MSTDPRVLVTTERLYLRPLMPADVTPAYVDALQDPVVIGLTEARHAVWDRQAVRAYVRRSNRTGVSQLLGIFLKEPHRHIGNVRLFNFSPAHRRVELGIMIFDASQWAKGYGTEALRGVSEFVFQTLQLHRICADYYAPNVASARMFSKAGFEIEGVFKGHVFLNGQPVDSIRVANVRPGRSDSPLPPGHDRHTPRALISSAGPSITKREVQLVTEAVREGWYGHMTRHLDEFERRFSAYTGMPYCLATSSGTASLHLAMMALDIGPGDEVVVPDLTWVASAAPICYVGAKPIFADVDPTTLCLSPESLHRTITKRTKAVVVVGLLGNLPEMDAIRSIVEARGIPIIEDAAQSLGAEYRGRKAGTFGTLGAFSFNGTKLLVTGEGGMVVTRDRRLYERLKRLQHHGLDTQREGKYYWSYELGYKYKMTNLQAALGLAQLSRIDELIQMRRRIFSWYASRLQGVEGVQLNQEGPHVKSTFWLANVLVSPDYGVTKETLVERLAQRRIASRPLFYPLSSMPTFSRYCEGKLMRRVNPVAYGLSPYGVSLPSAATLTEADVEDVCETLVAILRNGSKRHRSTARGRAVGVGGGSPCACPQKTDQDF